MRTPWLLVRSVVSAAVLLSASIDMAASTPQACPGPTVCGLSCSLDPSGVPIYCSSGGQCTCAPGYDTQTGPNGTSCWPHQPEFQGSFSHSAECQAGFCTQAVWATVGGISNAWDLVAVHGTSPGGEAYMPVWGHQANYCGVFGAPDSNGNPNWIKDSSGTPCTVSADLFCADIDGSDEADFSPPSCDNSEGCPNGSSSICVSDFTAAWPYLDKSTECQAASKVSCLLGGVLCGRLDPSRIDYPNNVIVYRSPIVFEDHSPAYGLDDDYTMDLHSPRGELYDTQGSDGRVHVEYDSDETIDHFTDNDWGAANQWWRDLRYQVDHGDGDTDQDARCYMRHFIDPNHTCPPTQTETVDPNPDDPTAVVVGVPSVDCADHPLSNTTEIHPALAVAIRFQQDSSKPEQWAFFYRRRGDNGGCGTNVYGRCDTSFQLPLSLPSVPSGQVLKSANVHVDWHGWADDDSDSSDVSVTSQFDLTNGTVLNISLPQQPEGVVGLVTVTPVFDTTPPQITCPGNITKTPDPGQGTAAVTFAETVSDDCSSVTPVCSSPSGTAFPLGTTTNTCTATDQAGNSASCSFTVNIIVTPQSIGTDVNQFLSTRKIASVLGTSLLQTLNAAANARARGNCKAANNNYQLFINEVLAQSGKKIDPIAAQILIADATYLMNHCP